MTDPNTDPIAGPMALDALLDELSDHGGGYLESLESLDSAGDDDGQIEPAYGNVSDWANDWLLPTVERRYAQGSRGGVYWCDQWWAHPEGLQRIYDQHRYLPEMREALDWWAVRLRGILAPPQTAANVVALHQRAAHGIQAVF